MRPTSLALAFSVLVPLCATAAEDEKAIADFYAKKTVTIAVGSSAGGNYDLYARLVARHIGRTFPASRSSWCRTCRAPAAAGSPMC